MCKFLLIYSFYKESVSAGLHHQVHHPTIVASCIRRVLHLVASSYQTCAASGCIIKCTIPPLLLVVSDVCCIWLHHHIKRVLHLVASSYQTCVASGCIIKCTTTASRMRRVPQMQQTTTSGVFVCVCVCACMHIWLFSFRI
jgi:hypothetical protein